MKVIHNLKESAYLFITEKGSFDNRFVLRFVDRTLKTDNFEEDVNKIFVSVKDHIILIDVNKKIIQEVGVFDILGRLIYKKNDVKTSKFSIENLSLKNQILVIKITLEDESFSTHKIII